MAPGWWNGAGNTGANGAYSQYGGSIPVGNLTDADRAFLEASARYMGGGFDPRNIASGSAADVNAALGGDTTPGIGAAGADTANFMKNVSPAVLQAMQQMVANNPDMQARWNAFTGQSSPGMGTGQGAAGAAIRAGSTDNPAAPQTNFGQTADPYNTGGGATVGSIAGGRNTAGPATPGTTGGNMAGATPTGGNTYDQNGNPVSGGSNTGNPMDAFINPMTDYMNQMGLKDLQSTYAGAGNLLSGPAMRGITDYGQKMALGQAWQPAFQDYLANQQQQYGMALNDQTIPFQQQFQLAQLGLQGTQGSSSLAATLAALLSGNTTAIGQAQAGGTIGGSNAIMNAISQYLANMMQQGTLNRVLPTGP
jgi:hypothetical protein